MVVVRHGGVVEEGGHGWLAGVLDEEVLRRARVVFTGAWEMLAGAQARWLAARGVAAANCRLVRLSNQCLGARVTVEAK